MSGENDFAGRIYNAPENPPNDVYIVDKERFNLTVKYLIEIACFASSRGRHHEAKQAINLPYLMPQQVKRETEQRLYRRQRGLHAANPSAKAFQNIPRDIDRDTPRKVR